MSGTYTKSSVTRIRFNVAPSSTTLEMGCKSSAVHHEMVPRDRDGDHLPLHQRHREPAREPRNRRVELTLD